MYRIGLKSRNHQLQNIPYPHMKENIIMNVKCPKCRYRFDTPASPGMTELQCNCPRCGIPFTYTVDDEQAANDHLTDQTESAEQTSSMEQSTHNPSNSPSQPDHVGSPNHSYTRKESPVHSKTLRSNTPSGLPNRTSQHGTRPPLLTQGVQTGKGCLKFTLIVAAAIILFIVFLVRQCRDKSYTAEDVTMSEIKDSEGEMGITDSPAPTLNKHVQHEEAPAWIQGNWHVDTDYGGISLKIHGNQIAETSGGETTYGSYTYQNPYLYCDFGDNNIFVYRLVEETKQIDAGTGILMNKLD